MSEETGEQAVIPAQARKKTNWFSRVRESLRGERTTTQDLVAELITLTPPAIMAEKEQDRDRNRLPFVTRYQVPEFQQFADVHLPNRPDLLQLLDRKGELPEGRHMALTTVLQIMEEAYLQSEEGRRVFAPYERGEIFYRLENGAAVPAPSLDPSYRRMQHLGVNLNSLATTQAVEQIEAGQQYVHPQQVMREFNDWFVENYPYKASKYRIVKTFPYLPQASFPSLGTPIGSRTPEKTVQSNPQIAPKRTTEGRAHNYGNPSRSSGGSAK